MSHQPPSSPFQARQDRLRALMETRHVPLILVSHLVNIRYLTGFTGSAGMALMGLRQGILWVDPRYTLQAREQAEGWEVIEEKKGILKGVAAWLRKEGIRDVAIEASSLTFAQFECLRSETGNTLSMKPAGDLIEDLRVVKDRGEIEAIRGAGKVTAEAFSELLPYIRPGVVERDLATEIEYRMRKKGAEGAAFESIVASGPRSAYPHARPSSKALQESELVIFDLGAILAGYAADMTRTVFLGEPNRRVRELYSAVLKAQSGAIRSVENGAAAGEVDSSARRILAKHRLARYFTHSTGHGVGLEIHERPRLGKGETTCLRSGSVVTVEPGVYLEGFGGVRIEDTVLVGPQGPEVLTPASKECWVIS
ncbi:MAG: Xaa-Pro peptidase family protein [Acidobacteriota bacterium]|nr:Xaa-Pro peptidase family protein [Acidobacteriota bacterium]